MAKTGNLETIPVKIFNAEANTHIKEFYIIPEHDNIEDNLAEERNLLRKLAGKTTLGEE
jgi:hypothetical protein